MGDPLSGIGGEISREQKVLLRALQPGGILEGDSGEPISTELNWHHLKEMALVQGVFPLLYHRLTHTEPPILPASERPSWRELFLINAQRNLRLNRKLLQILTFLNQQEIRAIPFKGPVLALQAFGDLSLRQFTDLDLLIHFDQAELVQEVLPRIGFKTEKPLAGWMKRNLARKGKESWYWDDNGSQLDIHFQFPEGPSLVRFREILWKGTAKLELDQTAVTVLSPENTLILLILHGSEHEWDSLKIAADLVFFIKANPGLDWGLITSRLREKKGLGLLMVGLGLARRLYGLSLPGEIKGPKMDEIIAEILEGIMAGVPSGKILPVMMRSLDSLSARIAYLGYYAFTPRVRDFLALPLPRSLYPFYYLYRPLRLLREVFHYKQPKERGKDLGLFWLPR